jgi:hypothetical protein
MRSELLQRNNYESGRLISHRREGGEGWLPSPSLVWMTGTSDQGRVGVMD